MEEITFPPLYELKRKYWIFVGYGPCPERFRTKWYNLYHIHTLEGSHVPDTLPSASPDRGLPNYPLYPVIIWIDAMQPELLRKLKTFPASQINVIHLRYNHDVDDVNVWARVEAEDLENIHELTFFKYVVAIYQHQIYDSFEKIA